MGTTFSSGTAQITLPTTTTNLVGDDTTNTLTNKTVATLTSTGTSQSLLSGKSKSNYFTGISTVGAVTATIATVAVPTNTQIIIEIFSMANCTASSGADLNKVRGTDMVAVIKNVAGTLTAFTVTSSNGGDAAFTPSITFIVSGTNIVVTANGVALDTISYAGNYNTYFA